MYVQIIKIGMVMQPRHIVGIQAEEKCRLNIKNFGGDPVLVEGGGYEKIWLETQPMGGAMYASRDFATGLNNSLMFMRHQRADGRIPGSIAVIDGKVVPQFNKFQGFCFPEPALDLYYLGGTFLPPDRKSVV